MMVARLGPRLDSKVTGEIATQKPRMAGRSALSFFNAAPVAARLANHRAKIGTRGKFRLLSLAHITELLRIISRAQPRGRSHTPTWTRTK
jgi:hypothetical protein